MDESESGHKSVDTNSNTQSGKGEKQTQNSANAGAGEPGSAVVNGSSSPSPKITIVRSQKSHSDLPAMKPLDSDSVQIPTAESSEISPEKRLEAASTTDFAEAKLEAMQASEPADAKTEAIAASSDLAKSKATAAKAASPTTLVTVEKSLINSSPTLSADSKFLDENLLRTQQELIDAREKAKASQTKFTLPAPDQPLPPPQAPPQFLGDQSNTRPSDASLGRSHFGTASQFGGAPIALLTNAGKAKKPPSQINVKSIFEFVKGNIIACALTLSLVVLATLILTNKDSKTESKIEPIKTMDLSILTTGQSLEEVNQLINAKKYQEALALCDKIIQKDVKFAEGYHSRGQVYMAMHRFREAVDDFSTAESFNHRSIDIHIDRAAALFQAQDFDKAKNEYDEIIVLNPRNAPAYFGKGLSEESLNMNKEAIADFEKTLELQADYAAANEEIGTIYFAQGDLKRAYDEYTKAIATSPDVPRFYFNRANALKKDHQIKRAIADYCKAIQLDPASPEFYNNRGLLYLENNETSKAITDFSSAIDLDPNYTMAKHNLTLAQAQLRR